MASFGGGYQRIAAKVGRSKLVADVLTEDEVRKLLQIKAAV